MCQDTILIQMSWFCRVVIVFYRCLCLVQIPATIAPQSFCMFFSENENNRSKIIVLSNATNHVSVAILIKVTAVRYSLTIARRYHLDWQHIKERSGCREWTLLNQEFS